MTQVKNSYQCYSNI